MKDHRQLSVADGLVHRVQPLFIDEKSLVIGVELYAVKSHFHNAAKLGEIVRRIGVDSAKADKRIAVILDIGCKIVDAFLLVRIGSDGQHDAQINAPFFHIFFCTAQAPVAIIGQMVVGVGLCQLFNGFRAKLVRKQMDMCIY